MPVGNVAEYFDRTLGWAIKPFSIGMTSCLLSSGIPYLSRRDNPQISIFFNRKGA